MQVGDLITYNVGSGKKSLGLILDKDNMRNPWTIGSEEKLYDCVQVIWYYVNKVPAQLDMGKRMSKRASVGDIRWYRIKTISGFSTFSILSSL